MKKLITLQLSKFYNKNVFYIPVSCIKYKVEHYETNPLFIKIASDNSWEEHKITPIPIYYT